MADAEYKRLGCAADGCGNERQSLGLCAMHYRRLKRHGTTEDLAAQACEHCGAVFQPTQRGAMYCSKLCKQHAWREKNPDRTITSAVRTVSAVFAGYCQVCGSAFVGLRRKKYCSEQCQPSTANKSEHIRGKYFTPKARICPHCLLAWSAIKQTGPSDYCFSPECVEARIKAHAKTGRSDKSHIARAKKHGRKYGYFNVLRVFERDKWRCKMCGVKTPSKLRGTYEPNAPEVGHIVALSVGGDHVMENIQCECRACNAAKGARPAGQTWLDGFADTL